MRLSPDPAGRRRLVALCGAAAAALVVGLVAGAGGGSDDAPSCQTGDEPGCRAAQRDAALAAVDRLSLRQQVGQLIVSTFPGTRPPAYVLRRLRARETAGVILFRANAESSPADWRRLTRAIQRNAHGEALVMADQEGGDVRTVGWAGPAEGQALQGSKTQVYRAAREAALQLRRAGVNVNLAPVADVATTPVMAGRAFASDVAARTKAAIAATASAHVAATAKHFPGLGDATVNTDDGSTTSAPRLAPFEAAIDADVPLVMVSHASYPGLDRDRIASQSPAVVERLLRKRLRYDGVVITDSIEAQAVLNRSNVARAAERSIAAGVDLVLTTGSASYNDIYPRLLARARRDAAFRERVRRSAARVIELKRWLDLD